MSEMNANAIFKKLFRLGLMALILVLCTTAFAQDMPRVDDTLVVSVKTLDVYDESSWISGEIVNTLNKGSRVKVLSVMENAGGQIWVRIGNARWVLFYNDDAQNLDFAEELDDVEATEAEESDADEIAALREENIRKINETRGLAAQIRAAGFTFTSVQKDARNPEEVVFTDEIFVAGRQVIVENLTAAYPACFSTDRRVRGESINYQPDPENESRLYTNNSEPYTGYATVWYDCSDWSELAPDQTVTVTDDGADEADETVCYTIEELKAYGTIIRKVYDNDELAGVQLRLTTALVAADGWTIQLNGEEVDSAPKGKNVTYWSDETCRPLALR